jgi:hypothetical protein
MVNELRCSVRRPVWKGLFMRTATILLGFSVVLLCTVQRAVACSCRPPPSSREEIVASTPVIFVGEILNIRMLGEGVRQSQITTLRVLKMIKGTLAETVDVTTSPDSAMCGWDFRNRGKQLLVGGYGQSDRLITDMCTMYHIHFLTKP